VWVPQSFIVEPLSITVGQLVSIIRNVQYRILLRAHETISGDAFLDALIVNNGFNRSQNLGPRSVPPCTHCSYTTQTIGGGGSTTVDLSALPATQRTLDARGKLQRFLRIINRSTSANLTVAQAASEAFEPFGAGNQPVLPPGCEVLIYSPNGLSIDASHKNLKLDGTAGQTADLAIVVG
jgi:hypothetical protein